MTSIRTPVRRVTVWPRIRDYPTRDLVWAVAEALGGAA